MAELVDQDSAVPTRKVSAAGAAGALAAIVAWAAQTWGGVDVPPGIEAAFATLLAFAAGYIVKERA